MAVLKSTNVQGALCVNGVAIGGGKDIKYCCFTASTTFTPSQNLVDGGGYVEASLVAGGGGGGGAGISQAGTVNMEAIGGGGGGGEVRTTPYLMTSSNACTVTIGAKGGPGRVTALGTTQASVEYANSTAGGDTTFLGETVYGGTGGSTVAYSCNRFNYEISPAVNGPFGGGTMRGRLNDCDYNKQACCQGGFGGSSTANQNNPFSEDPTMPMRFTALIGTGVTFSSTCTNTTLDTFCIPRISCVSSSIGMSDPSGSNVSGKENMTRDAACANSRGAGTMTINGKFAGGGGGTTGMCSGPMQGAASEYGGGGAGVKATIAGGVVVTCTGHSGSSGLVVLRWEE